MTLARYLVDTSALVRLFRDKTVRVRWAEQATAGLLAVCPIIELEFLYTARSKADREDLLSLIDATFVRLPMPDRVYSRAAEVQTLLTESGRHRSTSAVDLLVAATAELEGLSLLHYDRDYDQVVDITAQPAVWLAEPGSID